MTKNKQPKTENQQLDVWQAIDEAEEKYADLIDELEHPPALTRPKMKVTGASTREIPRLQEKRRGK